MQTPDMSQPRHGADITLVVKRHYPASPTRVFDAWTDPAQLKKWWGPAGVTCSHAEVDLRVGGSYRIGNLIPDGSTVWIFDEFLRVERPALLAYSWQVAPGHGAASRVTIRFDQAPGGTTLTLTHDRIHDEATRDDHEKGWGGCLAGLAAFLT
jgi:uncharacterized protein YndB with AHSA1/START domain